jgi:repressor LexA
VELSRRQSDALRFIALFSREHGYAPTVREVQEKLGHRSVSSTHAVLCSLKDIGAIDWNKDRPRTLRVVKT